MAEERELELRDYLEVIVKRKFLIISGTLIILLLTTVFSFFTSRTYEAEAVFQNAYFGKISGTGDNVKEDIIDNAEVPRIFQSESILGGVLLKYHLSRPEFLKNFSVENLKDSNFFKVSVKSSDPTAAREIANVLITRYFEYGSPILEGKVKLLDQKITRVKKEIEEHEAYVKKLQLKIEDLQLGSADSLVRSAYLNNLFYGYKDRLEASRNFLMSLENRRLSLKKFEIISPAEKPRSHLISKLKKKFLIAGFLGLVFFIYWAFFLEYWEKSGHNKM